MNIVLFVPYFRPEDPKRRLEIELCLEKNKLNPAFESIYLIVDEPYHTEIADERVKVCRVQSRPTYKDWVDLSYIHAAEGISLLANADIYFLDDVSRLADIFEADPTGFVAMSRFDGHDGDLVRHPNPHWSQDTWAFLPRGCVNASRDAQLNFPLGVPRCDNKAAYVFAAYGHNVYNPCNQIRSVHVHDSGIRSYSKKADMRIVGGMAMVHPCENLTTPSQLDVEFWPVQPDLFQSVTVNKSLGKWARELNLATPITGPVTKALPRRTPAPFIAQAAQRNASNFLFADASIVGFDAYWQHPAITEQHAFDRIKLLAPRNSEMSYLGFPWATFIDISNHNKQDEQRRSELCSALDACKAALKGYDRIATVCQHIHLKQYASLFSELGVTDIFWSHAVMDENEISGFPGLRIHPFPLFPVQRGDGPSLSYEARRFLFSFVGAKATPIYLSQARTHIIEELGGHPKGLVRERDTWHYNRIVYDSQVLNRAPAGSALVDEVASQEFRDVMRHSLFTLCPSGTGPNSIRLWEAICSDSIPVVLAETYRAPGNGRLWQEAVVECGEDRQSIAQLPARLEEIAADARSLLKRKAALRMLALRYGPDSFVTDVISAMRS